MIMIMGFTTVQVVCKIILEDTCNSKSPSFTIFYPFFFPNPPPKKASKIALHDEALGTPVDPPVAPEVEQVGRSWARGPRVIKSGDGSLVSKIHFKGETM